MLGNIHDEPQIVLNHFLPLQLTGISSARPVVFFLSGKQWLGANFVEVVLGNVVEQLNPVSPLRLPSGSLRTAHLLLLQETSHRRRPESASAVMVSALRQNICGSTGLF